MAVGGPRDAHAHYEAALRLTSDPVRRARAAVAAAEAANLAGENLRGAPLLQDTIEEFDAEAHPGEMADLLTELASHLRVLDVPGDPSSAPQHAAKPPPSPAATPSCRDRPGLVDEPAQRSASRSRAPMAVIPATSRSSGTPEKLIRA